ncbi:thioredoxin reductase/Fe-S-cluster-containing hydrogenase component 2 [Salinibacter ruber]|jgi:thioredoxin reductase/Fe-S-cluster-containing hydrogenase component 2|nr:FAD-dependent oxidoreductase [Salinibacter ruber]MBB4059579.1 thioredoxin reductase/Fe-S-cluster-containing hydrogenase component 2 [Salinibacter ruber]MBB4069110.1 thioredoxin reductase/Fe-S-cluster-containing hydrogenase component 2 [Salinibacter ruber]MCS3633914.1 thioredoxin reductase/Fe-S-cluster-containing hydrogenase component 2 [Salinibacter ruber]MCS3638203.1 thioredoxin reductase/Fe-S-cluster-containing hydrogenase component 2 [Salinibacter ruber]MCS3656507.1 thioredoxin reductase
MLDALARYANWLHLQWPAGKPEKLPKVDDHFRTNVDGVYVVGDLAGVPLLKFSVEGGAQAVRDLLTRGIDPVEPTGADGPYDVVIIGAGASGMAAAREAQKSGLSFCVLESQRRFATIKDFQAGKPIYTYPEAMTPASDLEVTAQVKEALVDELEAQTKDLPVRHATAHRIDPAPEGHEVVTTDGDRIRGQRVIVAIGRSGNFRSLDVPGEDKDHVQHRLHDPTRCRGDRALVIGGGDSAAEAATALTEAGADVTLSYRRDEFVRPKEENVERLYERATYHEGEGSLTLKMPTDVEEIREDEVVLSDENGDTETVDADHVFATIGREAPLDFFRRSGIELRNDWGEVPDSLQEAVSGLSWLTDLRWDRITAFAAFFFFMVAVYSWKDGGWVGQWAQATGFFPFGWSPDTSGTGALDILLTSMQKPGFYYTFAYSALVVVFGVKRIRRRKTPYIKVQTLTLMGIQVLPLFILPEFVLPYLGANGLLPTGVLDALFPTSEYAVHGRQYWRAYGFILAWPLFIWNVFTTDPLWWWLAICFVQTFVLIPGMIYFWGKGAYCGWICTCGALAETLGDQHREKMPHGPGWNKLNLAGQVIMGVAFALLVLRIGGWIWPGSWAAEAYRAVLYGGSLGLGYSWVVDILLAGMVGFGVYFWLSGRFWCRFFCPLAAIMHIYHRFSRFRILADKKKCISCNQCTSVCHQGIDVMAYAQKGEPMDDPECVRCSACVETCPTGVLEFGQVQPNTGEVIHRDALEASLTRIQEHENGTAA